tara:strand:- start:205 stop:906 length:702 start_codon:yes stop_codon:yes gene_type:complete
MKFIAIKMDELEKLAVNKETRRELEALLWQIQRAASKLGEFQDANPDLDLVSAGANRCPHCGVPLQNIGGEACRSCREEISWASTPPLRHAFTRIPSGHVYKEYLAGPCKPENIDRFTEYYKLRAVTAQLERDYVIKSSGYPKFYKKWEFYKKRGNCFVATACFGNEDHPTVTALRRFRDEKLAYSRSGQAFIVWYYRNGPSLARVVEVFPILRMPLRLILNVLAWIIGSAKV